MRLEIVILIIFFVLVFPFILRVSLEVNVLRNKGKIIVYLFSLIPIYFQFFEIDNGFIKLIKNPKKIKKLKLSFKKQDIKNFYTSADIILNNQIIKEFNITTKFGVKNQPYYVALISGLYNTIIGMFLSINCAKRNILNSHTDLKVFYKYTYLKININAKIKLTAYDIIKLLIQLKIGVKT